MRLSKLQNHGKNMETTKRLLGILFVTLASTALFIACSDDTSCLADTDCSTGEVCEADVCKTECATDADCADGEICYDRATTGGYCDAGTTPTTNNTTTNNDTNNTNNTTPFSGYIVQILDKTTDAGECAGDDPGSDIIHVTLEDADGNPLGYGNFVGEDDLDFPDNTHDLGAHIDGSPTSYGAQCPDVFDENSVYSLGCGGYVTVEFLDDGGIPIAYEAGMQISVLEYGIFCGGSAADDYDVILCDDTDGVKNNDDVSSCTNNLAGGSGDVVVTVTE